MLRCRDGNLIHDEQHWMPVLVRIGSNVPSHDRMFVQTHKRWFLDELHFSAEALHCETKDLLLELLPHLIAAEVCADNGDAPRLG